METKKILLSTIAIWLVGTAFTFLTCGWLFSWVYTIPPIIWKSAEEMMTTSNYLGSNVVGIVKAALFAIVFEILYKGIPGKKVKKGLMYGLILWTIALTGMASMPFYMTIAPVVVVYWIIQALVANLMYGAIVGWIYRKK